MRNIFKIFGRDVKSLSRHFFAFVVAIAIMILPSLYAWLNIYSNWDPYGNTGNISIAVASMDKGYVTDTGEKVNKGDDIIEDLRESTAINWVITDSEEQAVNGVYSGEYYAAVVIDENFSYNMYNMLTMWNGKPEITYYENAKKNAVATKITDTAVESLKRSINENYLEVLISGIMEQANVISAEIAEDNPREALHVVLQQALTTLNAAQRALDNFAAGGSGNISIDTSELDKIIADINSKLPEGSEIRDNVAQIDLAVYEALEKVQASLDRLQNAIESGNAEAIAAAKKAVEKAAADAIACGDKVSGWGDAIPGDTQVGQDAKALAQKIADNFYDLGKWLNALPHRDDIQEAIGDCTDIVDTIFGLTDTIVPSAEELTKAVEDIFLNVATTLDSVRKLNNDALVLRDAVESTKAALDDTLHAMQPAASRVIASLTETLQKLDSITTDEDYFAALVDLLGGSPAVYGQYLAQIVQTSVTPIYPIANYGSAMAPFYSVLAVWVGGVILRGTCEPQARAAVLRPVSAVLRDEPDTDRDNNHRRPADFEDTMSGAGASVPDGLRHELYLQPADIFSGRVLWRCRQGDSRRHHGSPDRRLQRHLPDRAAAGGVPEDISVLPLPLCYRRNARMHLRPVRQYICHKAFAAADICRGGAGHRPVCA